MCEITHLHVSTCRVFNGRRGHRRTQKLKKHRNPWRLEDSPWELSPLPRPDSRPSAKALHPRSEHFGLPASALEAEATEGPQVTVETGPLRALPRH